MENRVESDTPTAEQGKSGAQGTGACLRVDPRYLNGLDWRCIGPFRGGRVVAVTGDPQDPLIFYFGATAGGVWKTYDAGTYWECISDDFFKTAAVGAIAVADSDPAVVYVGMGEACLRHDVSHGDGVYRSLDGGKTWDHLGLEDTRHISRIRVHPQDPDLVYVAALGHAFGPNKERGVYRSKNGGRDWEQVLFKSDKAGAIDLSMDPNNPRILYAAIYQVMRRPWKISSGGPGSALYKSMDGGDTWTDLGNSPGMPRGIKGRISVAVSPARPGRVWALIEAEDGALLRSDDDGTTWERMTEDPQLRRRPWYFNHLFADTRDPETCYVLSFDFWKSTDGGRTFHQEPMPHGDHHDLWIDPRNPDRMIEGSDGGATVTLNGAASWSTLYNQPTASIFHLDTDMESPYKVYGTQMDNSAICVPSRVAEGAIPWKDCFPVGSSESGYIVVRPDDHNIIYSGAYGSAPGGGGVLLRFDRRTEQSRIITVWPEDQGSTPAKDVKYRFFFTFPIVLSPHDPNILYTAANVVFRSTDEGTSWEAISPDLTRNDASKMVEISGGPITTETAGAADYYGTIYTFAESPHEAGVLWAGSDDGLIHISQDNGKTWQNVTPSEIEEGTLISTIEVSPHNPATAYAAVTRYKLDDYRPLIYKTSNYGQSWRKITDGIRENDFVRVVREDQDRQGLLYAGTETGVYVSFDNGASWQPLQSNLPAVPVHDLKIKDDDLIAATHGRSFWIMDDLTALRQITAEVAQASIHLFKPRGAYRISPPLRWIMPTLPGKNYHIASGEAVTYYQWHKPNGEKTLTYLNGGKNPPDGVAVHYYLKHKPEEEVKLAILDSQGKLIKSFSSRASKKGDASISADVGMNRFVWDLRYPGSLDLQQAMTLPAYETPRAVAPLALPGKYRVHLTVGDREMEESFEVRKDPRIKASDEDLSAQFSLQVRVGDKLSEIHQGVDRLRSVRRQVEGWVRRAEGSPAAEAVVKAAEGIKGKLSAIEEEVLRIPGPNPMYTPPNRLNAKLASLTDVIASADWVPTRQTYQVFDQLSAQADELLRQLQQVIDEDIASLVHLINDYAVPPIVP